jgi:hypothetical protein
MNLRLFKYFKASRSLTGGAEQLVRPSGGRGRQRRIGFLSVGDCCHVAAAIIRLIQQRLQVERDIVID